MSRYRTKTSIDAITSFSHDCLRSAALFKNRDPVFLEKITEYLQLEIFLAGKDILVEGQSGDKMYFLHRGEVEVLVGPERRRVAKLQSGNVFGEMALFGVPKRAATVRATEFCDCRTIHHTHFQKILANFPGEQVAFEKLYSERTAQLHKLQQSGSRRRRLSWLAALFQKLDKKGLNTQDDSADNNAQSVEQSNAEEEIIKSRKMVRNMGKRHSIDGTMSGLEGIKDDGDRLHKKRHSIGFYIGNFEGFMDAIDQVPLDEYCKEPDISSSPADDSEGNRLSEGNRFGDQEVLEGRTEASDGHEDSGLQSAASSRCSTPHAQVLDAAGTMPMMHAQSEATPSGNDLCAVARAGSQEIQHDDRGEQDTLEEGLSNDMQSILLDNVHSRHGSMLDEGGVSGEMQSNDIQSILLDNVYSRHGSMLDEGRVSDEMQSMFTQIQDIDPQLVDDLLSEQKLHECDTSNNVDVRLKEDMPAGMQLREGMSVHAELKAKGSTASGKIESTASGKLALYLHGLEEERFKTDTQDSATESPRARSAKMPAASSAQSTYNSWPPAPPQRERAPDGVPPHRRQKLMNLYRKQEEPAVEEMEAAACTSASSVSQPQHFEKCERQDQGTFSGMLPSVWAQAEGRSTTLTVHDLEAATRGIANQVRSRASNRKERGASSMSPPSSPKRSPGKRRGNTSHSRFSTNERDQDFEDGSRMTAPGSTSTASSSRSHTSYWSAHGQTILSQSPNPGNSLLEKMKNDNAALRKECKQMRLQNAALSKKYMTQ